MTTNNILMFEPTNDTYDNIDNLPNQLIKLLILICFTLFITRMMIVEERTLRNIIINFSVHILIFVAFIFFANVLNLFIVYIIY